MSVTERPQAMNQLWDSLIRDADQIPVLTSDQLTFSIHPLRYFTLCDSGFATRSPLDKGSLTLPN